jgi:hypothetical protein
VIPVPNQNKKHLNNMPPRLSPEIQKNPEKDISHRINKLVATKVTTSDTYLRERALIYSKTGDGDYAPAAAFRIATESIAQEEDNELSQPDRDLLKVVGILGTFAEAQEDLNRINSVTRLFTEREKQVSRHLKDAYIIPFNHNVKEFINTHPDPVGGLDAVTAAFASTQNRLLSPLTSIHPKELVYKQKPKPHEVALSIEESLRGMRNEVAAETLLTAAGIEYDYRVSTKDDAKGTDLFVFLDGRWEGVDLKASRLTAESAQSDHRLSRAVWTGLNPGDFTGPNRTSRNSLSIPYSVAEKKSEAFVAAIREMVQRNRTLRLGISPQVAKRAVAHA